jgi:hypothetical protein
MTFIALIPENLESLCKVALELSRSSEKGSEPEVHV